MFRTDKRWTCWVGSWIFLLYVTQDLWFICKALIGFIYRVSIVSLFSRFVCEKWFYGGIHPAGPMILDISHGRIIEFWICENVIIHIVFHFSLCPVFEYSADKYENNYTYVYIFLVGNRWVLRTCLVTRTESYHLLNVHSLNIYEVPGTQ